MSKRVKIAMLAFVLMFSFIGNSYARTPVESLPQVEKLFMEGKYDRVVTESNRLIDEGAHGREELFYLKGLSQIQLSRFKDARETFRYMIERYPRDRRAFDGGIGIGDAFFLEGKIPESITSYNEALDSYPDHKNASIVYHKLGNAYHKLGSKDKAREYFDKARNSSPLSFESKMMPDAGPASVNISAHAPSKEILMPQTDDTGDYFYVQAGYFKNKGNAEKLTDGLKRKGYDSYLSAQIKAGFIFYRVKVGRFKTKAQAEDMAGRLKADGYKTKVCR
ncbi:MAG: hypothetical protein A3I73_02465 [Omnitrophica bacterium RIFCSPLOWO2_02_FULL_45_16]|nr:MAG: hypothetical protein A3C51_05780 [Omnitrophica bacterium RIFCSPHIGHO2_02_FULL_46_20]OGW93097.1 MAG: hypothetical protein A3K16_00495 [Omnitrophica bacterium RIFCSPLOWO2_01_FULL_45_24]OGX00459.1 MAG: hypothetical protein A3I73_02465 [Omnitrophica bacterium RIFCSPLOWO2_02_FULL_45_16]